MRFEADAFLFDLDGTLVNSLAVVERVWREWALEHNLDPKEVVAACHGRRSLDTILQFAPHLPLPEANNIIIERETNDTQGVFAIAGAVELLKSLPVDKWAIVTSCTMRLARARMEAAGIPVPPVMVVAEDVSRGKPDPQGFLLAAERLGIEPTRCLVFEDAVAGIEAGKRGGMQVITVTATHRAPATTGNPIRDYRQTRLLKTSPLSFEIGAG